VVKSDQLLIIAADRFFLHLCFFNEIHQIPVKEISLGKSLIFQGFQPLTVF